jgi:flavorubredoxin
MKKPRLVADDIYMIGTDFPAAHLGYLPVNFYLIHGREPVLVDTGVPIERDELLPTLESLLDPADIKWIFLTHDDNDHAGNLELVMHAAPLARLVIPFLGLARMADSHVFPPERLLLINPGQSFQAGDRELTVFRPPIWDSPATHCLYDPKSDTFFSSDSLGALIPHPGEELADVLPADYAYGFTLFAGALCPWLHMVDQNKFCQHLEHLRKLNPHTLLSSHGLIAQGMTDMLLEMLLTVPEMEVFVGPDQQQMMAIMAEMRAAAV